MFLLMLVFFWLENSGLTLIKAQEYDQASDCLYEYGVGLYRAGNTADAIHEFKKCLMVNPANLKCRTYLDLISAGPKPVPKLAPLEKEIHPPQKISSRIRIKLSFTHNIQACVNKEVSFYARVSPEKEANSLNYAWDFGHGTSASGSKATKIYSAPGLYYVRLDAYDESMGRIIRSVQNRVRVYSPPLAEAGEDKVICLGRSVILDGSKSMVTNSIERCFNCDLLTYTWDFGDGTPQVKGVKVSHTYGRPGNYKATLTVQDGKGRKCSISKDNVSVLVNARAALVLIGVRNACVAKSTNFVSFLNASESYYLNKDALKYTWDFGDGDIAKGAQVTHVYKKGGKYKVMLKVDDNSGTNCGSSTASMEVSVSEEPVSIMKVR